ncbi:MAG: tetratricopeptide repeat protein, partial [Xanthobacteraceae bacterium]
MKGLMRRAHIGAAIITLAAAMPAIVLPNAAARADFDADQKFCNGGGPDTDGRIAACTRQIESGRWQGHSLAISYNNRGILYHDKGELDRAVEDYNR